MRIAILGMGNMGRAFATRALEGDYDVTVWNRTPGKVADLIAAGAHEAEAPSSAAADADAVFAVLADDAAVLDVCPSVLASLGPTAVFANISTVSPDTARRLAEAGPAERVLDSPVMGSPVLISAGHGRFMIGGPAAAINALDPLWEDLGSGYLHCGPAGAGATMKLISNMLLITGVTALAEGIATARHHGISDDLLRQVFGESMVISPASQVRLENLLDPHHPGWFTPALARKDVRLALALATEAGLGVRVGAATEELLTKLIDAGGQWEDFSAVIEALG